MYLPFGPGLPLPGKPGLPIHFNHTISWKIETNKNKKKKALETFSIKFQMIF